MTNEDEVKADAKNRAWRTFVQGLGLDVLVAVTLVAMTAFTNIEWTKEYWIALGLTLAKSILQAVASYFMRVFVTPRMEGGQRG